MIAEEVRQYLPAGATVEVLWADLPLFVARAYTADRGACWSRTRLPIMRAFSL